MINNPYNYMNPFPAPNQFAQQPMQPQQTLQPQPTAAQDYVIVKWITGGAQGALKEPLAPNSSALYMDRDNLTMFSRTKDISGRELPMVVYNMVQEKPQEPKSEDEILEEKVEAIVAKVLKKQNHYNKDRKNQNNEVNNG